MDPLSALSIASATAQFVQFGASIASEIVDRYGSATGAAKRHVDLEESVRKTTALVRDIEATVPPPFSLHEDTVARARLVSILSECKAAAAELLQILESLKATSKDKLISSIRATFKAVSKQDEVQRLRQKWTSLQEELSKLLLVLIHNKQSATGTAIFGLAKRMESMGLGYSNSLSVLTQLITQRINEKDKKEITDGIVTYLSELIENYRTSQDRVEFFETLRYPTMKMRESNISEAHKRTYDWILTSTPKNRSARDSGFLDWLKSGRGLFWVAGKPGSGKSTLLKFVASDRRTRAALESWARGSPLVIAGHFFWYAGHELQKSQEGLLRTLLDQILTKCPELIPLTCPTRWNDRLSRRSQWTMPELWSAFRRLTEAPTFNAKFCLFIDALDEYAGKPEDLIDVMKALQRCPRIKVCMSSREWPIFQHHFGSHAPEQGATVRKLCLQDYTKHDISHYVTSRLSVIRGVSTERQALVQEVTNMAQGVFLWVSMACDELLRGYINADSWELLKRRLRGLPQDLEPFFLRMIDRVEPIYGEQCARIFKLLLSAQKPVDINLFGFLLSDAEDSTFRLSENRRERKGPLETQYASILSRQVKARGADIVDIVRFEARHKVMFMHRTIFEFLSTPAMQVRLTEMLRSQHFTSSLYLCREVYRNLKMTPMFKRGSSTTTERRDLVMEAIRLMGEFENETKTTDAKLLDRIDELLICCDMKPMTGSSGSWQRGDILRLAASEGLYEYVRRRYIGIWQFASILRVDFWRGFRYAATIDFPLLVYALFSPDRQCISSDPDHQPWKANVRIVNLLLQRGASPNERFHNEEPGRVGAVHVGSNSATNTPWKLLLSETLTRFHSYLEDHCLDAIVALIGAGACHHGFDPATQLPPRLLDMTSPAQLAKIKRARARTRFPWSKGFVLWHLTCHSSHALGTVIPWASTHSTTLLVLCFIATGAVFLSGVEIGALVGILIFPAVVGYFVVYQSPDRELNAFLLKIQGSRYKT